MTDWISTYKTRACLLIRSDLPLTAIEAHMGVAGELRSWSRGDARIAPRGQRRGVYGFSLWRLNSGVEEGQPIEDHLQSLWRRMAPLRDRILALPDTMCATIDGTAAFASHRDRFTLSAGHYKTAACFGLPLDFDFVFDDDFGLDESTPYWVW